LLLNLLSFGLGFVSTLLTLLLLASEKKNSEWDLMRVGARVTAVLVLIYNVVLQHFSFKEKVSAGNHRIGMPHVDCRQIWR
jgi:uncharacterized membrane protein YbhN (UPF0104 family)